MAIKLIITSTRPIRVADGVAAAVAPLLTEGSGREVEIVDLREVALPLLDEPQMPKLGKYELEHTKAWAALIGGADAIVWLTPEYNGFFTAAAKNAIDCLYQEWVGKPMGIIGYGFGGAGRAIPALSTLLGNVEADVVGDVKLPFGDHFGPEGLAAAALVDEHADAIRALGAQLA